jgi:hypothetical protein
MLRFSPASGGSISISSFIRGPQGAAATVAIGAVATLAPGATPTVANVGTTEDAVLNFGLPTTPTISVGTTTTKSAGTSATAANSGTASAQVYDFGIPRGADGGLKFAFESSTTMAAPSSGGVRFNNATPGSITQVAISATDADGNPVRPYMLTWDDSTNTAKGAIVFKREANGTAIILLFNGTITDNTTWLQIPVTWSAGVTLFSAADPVYVRPDITGNKGADGSLSASGTPTVGQLGVWTSATALKGVSVTGLVKGNGASDPTAAVSGTDYAPATSGSAILKGNGSGGFSAATAGTDYLDKGTTSLITKGFTVTPNNLGNITNFTIDAALGNYQYGTNHAAATWTAPTADCAVDILVTNDATAGSITFSGFTVGSNTGDALTTTNTSKFIISIRRINSVSTYTVKALQ